MLDSVGELPPELLAPEPTGVEDAGTQFARAAELQAVWNVRPGQIWGLANHRIVCGDCRDAAVWDRVLAGEKLNGVVTSPPYAEQRVKEYGGVPIAEYVPWFNAVQSNVQASLTPDGSFFINIKPHCADGQRVLYVFDLVLQMARAWGWYLVDEFCWLHIAMPGAYPNRFKNEFEPVYHFCRSGQPKFRPNNVKYQSPDAFTAGGGVGDGYGQGRMRKFNQQKQIGPGGALPSNVILAQNEVSGATVHAAQFPVALPTFFLNAFSDPDDLWGDPFLGGGTTLIAAQHTGRRCIGIEVKPEYVSVTLDRVANSFGIEPELLADER
jgi:site-specific DNA-methyltransferase (adenine-specific)